MKKCSRCKVEQDVKQFTKDSTTKDGLRGQCKKCQTIFAKQRYKDNKEKILAQSKQWKKEHKEEIAAYNKKWSEENPEYDKHYKEAHKEEIKQYNEAHRDEKAAYDKLYRKEHKEEKAESSKKWYEENKEEILVQSKQYREEHKEEAAAYNKQWRKNNPDVKRVHDQNRRARKAGNGGTHTVQEWVELKEKYNYTCLCCGRQEPDIKITADHIIPIVKGGTNFISNIQPLCRSCNSTKHDKTIDYRNESIKNERITN